MRIAGWIAGLVALALVAFFALAPGITERGMNRIEGARALPSTSSARTPSIATRTTWDTARDGAGRGEGATGGAGRVTAARGGTGLASRAELRGFATAIARDASPRAEAIRYARVSRARARP